MLSLLSCVFVLSACNKTSSSSPQGEVTPSAVASTAASATPSAAPAVAENALGKKVYGNTCSMCHAANVAGAPKPGDKADWAPRIAQGMDTLYKHAIDGYTGAKGQMPPRGGATTLGDDDVKAAVDHMVNLSR
jgi:cytochrome c5